MNCNCVTQAAATPAGACFSPDRSSRYVLWRTWEPRKPVMAALMLNPSIADEDRLDPTLTRVFKFARSWGFGSMRILNCFALVSTDPDGLRAHVDRWAGDAENDAHICAHTNAAHRVMVGWGSNMDKSHLRFRVPEIRALLRNHEFVYAWRLTASGQPTHPLYLPASTDPVPYEVK